MVEEVERAIFELGDEGRLLEIQLKELVGDLENEELLIVKDYMSPSKKKLPDKILEEIEKLNHEDLMKSDKIAKCLGIKTLKTMMKLVYTQEGIEYLIKYLECQAI